MTAHQQDSTPKVVDHTFYLWDDTDEVTRTLCGVGCGFGPEDHITSDAFRQRARLRDAAPLMLEALDRIESLAVSADHDLANGKRFYVGRQLADIVNAARAVLAAARPATDDDGEQGR